MSNIGIIRGDDYEFTTTFTDEAWLPINLTWATVYFTVKKEDDYTNDDVNAVIAKVITSHTTPLSWITTITLSHTDTNIAEWEYYYDIQLKDTSNKISSIYKAKFIVARDITKS